MLTIRQFRVNEVKCGGVKTLHQADNTEARSKLLPFTLHFIALHCTMG
jgi:hypothetical protein